MFLVNKSQVVGKACDTENVALHFMSANGMPSLSYRSFLNVLSDELPGVDSWTSLESRGAWPMLDENKSLRWWDYVDDLDLFLQRQYAGP